MAPPQGVDAKGEGKTPDVEGKTKDNKIKGDKTNGDLSAEEL